MSCTDAHIDLHSHGILSLCAAAGPSAPDLLSAVQAIKPTVLIGFDSSNEGPPFKFDQAVRGYKHLLLFKFRSLATTLQASIAACMASSSLPAAPLCNSRPRSISHLLRGYWGCCGFVHVVHVLLLCSCMNLQSEGKLTLYPVIVLHLFRHPCAH